MQIQNQAFESCVIVEILGPGIRPNDELISRERTIWEYYGYSDEDEWIPVEFKLFTNGKELEEDVAITGNFNAWQDKLDLFFDDLYAHDFSGIHDGKKVNRNALKQMHQAFLSKGTQLRLVYFRKSGAYCYDMKLSCVNKERGEFSMRKLVTIEDDKIANSIDYNGTLASTRPNEKGYGLSYWWHLPVYLLIKNEEKASGEKRTLRQVLKTN